ncbi:MAG: response regulator transcription factor [Methylotenera sp.]|nr:response regulator transcription factor [Methylotenera sp.]MDO9389786.1 response regulator transcription factor [Methylotenera sp.]MDP1595887.1 response regulator transcription factor [Methylotenera sp.]MDP1755124.1 response regulator transcription factor [Methylotenera sp.]MDP1958294.1 response regulator transcription factor [Methylotenera sp.]
MKIAFLEDEISSALPVIEWLKEAGHDVDWFKLGQECIHALLDRRYDVCLLDWMLPDVNGTEVLEHLKLKGALPPVIFLTSRNTEEDIVRILQAGADDYIVKPPNKKILLSRIDALIRRSTTKPKTIEHFGHLSVNYMQHKFELESTAVKLTEKETFLALYIFKHIGTLVSRTCLSQAVWGISAEINSRTIDVHICHLREKLKLTPEHGWRLNCINRQGYRLERLEY